MMRLGFFSLLTLLMAFAACKRRAMPEVQVASPVSPVAKDSDLTSLQRQRDDLIAELQKQQVGESKRLVELTLERDELNSRKTSAESMVLQLQKDLDAKKEASATEKAEIQKKLDAATKERDALKILLDENATKINDLMKVIESLNAQNKELKDKITELNTKIDQMNNDLAKSRADTETASVSTQETVASTTSSAATTSAQSNPMPTPTPAPTPGMPTATPTPTPTASTGTLSSVAWQFYQVNADATKSCFEFGSTTANSSLLALSCVIPPPVRQQFKTETFSGKFLLIDQRTLMCIRLDSAAANQSTARVLLAPCLRGGDLGELWQFSEVNTATAEFKFKSAKTANCLAIGTDKKVAQAVCASATNLLSNP